MPDDTQDVPAPAYPIPPGYAEADIERWLPEPPKSRGRTAFERDRARLVHSSALRRLGAKTQVLGPGTDDFVRTRLTHTLEVAQVGRQIGKALGCDPDLVDSACLAHDLGHPPFGHNGERALDQLASDIGGFEGNAQTLRLLTRLEPKVVRPDGRGVGLNLTRAALDAAVKYPWTRAQAPRQRDSRRPVKFGVYEDDRPVFEWLRAQAPSGVKCLEAQIMDLADDISYCVHDVEDGVVGGRIDLTRLDDAGERERVVAAVHSWYGEQFDAGELEGAIDRLLATGHLMRDFDHSRRALAALKDATSQLIGRFSGAVQRATRERYGPVRLTRYGGELVVPRQTGAEILVLKGVAVAYVMAPREREPLYARQREILGDLVRAMVERAPVALEVPFAEDWKGAADDDARLRVVVDQVASLTDVSALQIHSVLCGEKE